MTLHSIIYNCLHKGGHYEDPQNNTLEPLALGIVGASQVVPRGELYRITPALKLILLTIGVVWDWQVITVETEENS